MMSRAKSRQSSEVCGDCGSTEPTWASINKGILVCNQCCHAHRSLGRHISMVKSLTKSTWPPSQLAETETETEGTETEVTETEVTETDSTETSPTNTESQQNDNQEEQIEQSLCFDPPVYRQRYAAIQQLLTDPRWASGIKKIVDFGCAELALFNYLKNIPNITNVLLVDIDREILDRYKRKVEPLACDYLKERSEQITVDVLRGCITQSDVRLKNVDAIVGIELVEHLYPDVLDVFPANVFGFIKPKIVAFTTPNADFNVLFPGFTGFRHFDHKFEWSREQFKDWADNIITRFPEYTCYFEGIGAGPPGTEHLGCCSQMVVFVRNDNYCIEKTAVYEEIDVYESVSQVIYPINIDTRSTEEKVLHKAWFVINKHAHSESRFFNEETQCVEVPLSEIYFHLEEPVTIKKLTQILNESKWKVADCTLKNSDLTDLCVIYDVNNTDDILSSPSNDEYESDTEVQKRFQELKTETMIVEEDWDTEFVAPHHRSDRKRNFLTSINKVLDEEDNDEDISDFKRPKMSATMERINSMIIESPEDLISGVNLS